MSFSNYEWKYDTIAKAGYLKLSEEKVHSTLELTDNVILDRDEEGNIIGIEIIK